MYLALNKRGQSRKVQIRASQQLGKLSTYTRVLTQPVSPERVESLVNRLLASSGGNATHPLRHHGVSGHLCALTGPQGQTGLDKNPKHAIGPFLAADNPGVDRLRCRRRKKRKKKRRRCEDDEEDEMCIKKKPFEKVLKKNVKFNKNCDATNKEECQRITNKLVTVKKNPNKKPKFDDKQLKGVVKKKKQEKQKTNNNKNNKKLNKKLKVSQEVVDDMKKKKKGVVELEVEHGEEDVSRSADESGSAGSTEEVLSSEQTSTSVSPSVNTSASPSTLIESSTDNADNQSIFLTTPPQTD